MKIDCHMHVNGRYRQEYDDNNRTIETVDKLGIDQLCVFIPTVRGIPTVDEGRENDDDEEVSRTHSGLPLHLSGTQRIH